MATPAVSNLPVPRESALGFIVGPVLLYQRTGRLLSKNTAKVVKDFVPTSFFLKIFVSLTG
jgi:hypothetical protein